MGFEELNGKYQRLRTELDAAYAGPVWNSSRIDKITEQIVQVELALATALHAGRGAALRSFGASDGDADAASSSAA